MAIHTDNRHPRSRPLKPAAVAGLFYPGDRAELAGTIRRLMAEARGCTDPPKAIVAPHAGYQYSGAVAASAYAQLAGARGRIRRVVLAGPAHRVGFSGVAVCDAAAFATPLGDLEVDRLAVGQALSLPFVQRLDAAFAEEHSLEVHLPFLAESLVEFEIVPLLVGEVSPADMATLLELLWGGPETAIVISTDLSHFHDYQTARRLDAETNEAICALRYEDIGPFDACGCRPLAGLLLLARRKGLSVSMVDLRNSGDTAGGVDRVVGYGAWVLRERSGQPLMLEERRTLLSIALDAVRAAAEGRKAPVIDAESTPRRLREPGACFVTLRQAGRLRGCIGSLTASRPLVEDVAVNAAAAALSDPRFSAVTAADLGDLEVTVSVLSPPEPLTFSSEADLIAQLRPGVDGLVLRDGERRGTFLPTVWESLATPERFVRELKRKAGLEPDHWSETLEVDRYTTLSF